MPVTTASSPARRSERGFSLVEIIVASVVLLIVSAGAMSVINGASSAMTRTKVLARQKQYATAVVKRAMADTQWIERYGCATLASCTIPPSDPIIAKSAPAEPDGTVTHSVTFVAERVDMPSDGVGAADADGVVPDAYRLQVTNTITAPGVFATPPRPYVASATLDMSGRGTTGTLDIRSCKIEPQVDERIGTGMCDGGATETWTMSAPGICTPGTFDCDAWTQAVATDQVTYATVTVSPFSGAAYKLVGPVPHSTASQVVTSDSAGFVRVKNLKPGQYRIEPLGTAGSTYEFWPAKSTPAGGYATVGAGELREAVQLFRPTRTAPVRLEVQTIDRTDPTNPIIRDGVTKEVGLKLVPIPSNRDVPERGGPTLGWTNLTPGQRYVDLMAEIPGRVSPGLYAAQLVAFPGDATVSLDTGGQTFVWIPPGGSPTSPASLEMTQEYCDVAARKAIIAATCPLGYRFCFVNGQFIGGCDEKPPAPTQGSLGSGGA